MSNKKDSRGGTAQSLPAVPKGTETAIQFGVVLPPATPVPASGRDETAATVPSLPAAQVMRGHGETPTPGGEVEEEEPDTEVMSADRILQIAGIDPDSIGTGQTVELRAALAATQRRPAAPAEEPSGINASFMAPSRPSGVHFLPPDGGTATASPPAVPVKPAREFHAVPPPSPSTIPPRPSGHLSAIRHRSGLDVINLQLGIGSREKTVEYAELLLKLKRWPVWWFPLGLLIAGWLWLLPSRPWMYPLVQWVPFFGEKMVKLMKVQGQDFAIRKRRYKEQRDE